MRVEVRVLQNVEDGREIHISARPAAGLWQTLGRIPLALDDGFSPRGRYRYGDISVDVGLPNRSSPVTVHVRVWQDVRDDQNIYVSARGSLGEWDTLGTISLPLDDGLTSDRALRYGDVRLEVPLPTEAVSTLAGQAGDVGRTRMDPGPKHASVSRGSQVSGAWGWPRRPTGAWSWRTGRTTRFVVSRPTVW